MIIEYLSKRDNKDDQSVEFNITDEIGDMYRFRADIPKDVEGVQAYLESHARDYMFRIRLKEYRSNGYTMLEGKFVDNYERMEAWILAGHKVQIGIDENDLPVYKVLDKQVIDNFISNELIELTDIIE